MQAHSSKPNAPRTQNRTVCTLCNRGIKRGSRIVEGVGPVGPECHAKIAGLEHYLAAFDGKLVFPRATIERLKDLGFKVRTKCVGSKDGRTYHRVDIVGMRREKPQALETYAQRRARFARELAEAGEKSREQVAA